jgi:hypothetical protein
MSLVHGRVIGINTAILANEEGSGNVGSDSPCRSIASGICCRSCGRDQSSAASSACRSCRRRSPATRHSSSDCQKPRARSSAGSNPDHLRIVRGFGRETATIAKLEIEESDQRSATGGGAAPGFGLSLRDVTSDIARQLRLPPGARGAVVDNVEPFTPASNAGVRPGDVILEVRPGAVRGRGVERAASDQVGRSRVRAAVAPRRAAVPRAPQRVSETISEQVGDRRQTVVDEREVVDRGDIDAAFDRAVAPSDPDLPAHVVLHRDRSVASLRRAEPPRSRTPAASPSSPGTSRRRRRAGPHRCPHRARAARPAAARSSRRAPARRRPAAASTVLHRAACTASSRGRC